MKIQTGYMLVISRSPSGRIKQVTRQHPKRGITHRSKTKSKLAKLS